MKLDIIKMMYWKKSIEKKLIIMMILKKYKNKNLDQGNELKVINLLKRMKIKKLIN